MRNYLYSASRKVQPLARRRDALVICASCGRSVRRKARRQVFCSARCRARAHYAKIVAEGGFNPVSARGTGLLTTPPKKTNKINGQQRADSGSSIRINGPPTVVEVEVFSGRVWREVVSPDGVRVEVGRLLPRALLVGTVS